MKITPIQITIADLTKNYKDDGDGGVFGYDGRLTIRPSFQREFHFLSAHSISLSYSTRIHYLSTYLMHVKSWFYD